MTDEVQGVPAPAPSAGSAIPQVSQAPQGQPFVNINWSNFKP